MPRIDPLQLLKCLAVLLTPNGGIRSKEEVQRLASLMMKFSKKLVSKCVYILILKNTDIELLGMFMSAGGWTLVYTWLSDGIYGKNWALVSELLELLLICPVDVERLKSNSIPRLVKGLSKDESLGGVNILAGRLVEQWLKIVKDEAVPDKEIVPTSVVQIEEPVTTVLTQTTITEPLTEVTLDTSTTEKELNTSVEIPPQTFYKVTVRDGKQVIHKIETDKVDGLEANHVNDETDTTQVQTEVKEKKEITEKKSTSSSNKDRSKHDKSKHRSSSSSSSSKSSHSHSSSNKEKTSSSSSGSNSSSTSSNKDKHRDRSRDKKHRERDREHRSNGSVKSSSSSNIKDKEKQAEKDKATLAKIQPQSVDKLGKIPKKSSSTNDKDKSKNDKKDSAHKTKPSISIEVRKKTDGERPKTVKVFNSKLRSTGLEEAPKPPPSRQSVTKKTPTLPSVMPVKRPSPSREAPPPPEKKIKLPDSEEKQDKVGGIKLIPPKPKHILEDNGTTGFVSFTSRWINEEQHLIQQFVKKQQPKALSTFIRPRVWILYFIIWSMMISVLFVYLPKLLFKFCGQHLSFIFKTDIKSDVPLWKICL